MIILSNFAINTSVSPMLYGNFYSWCSIIWLPYFVPSIKLTRTCEELFSIFKVPVAFKAFACRNGPNNKLSIRILLKLMSKHLLQIKIYQYRRTKCIILIYTLYTMCWGLVTSLTSVMSLQLVDIKWTIVMFCFIVG